MAFVTSIVLNAGDADARAVYLSYQNDPGRGLVVILGSDQTTAWSLAKNNADSGGDPSISAIWAQDPNAISADISALPGGNNVDATIKTVSINRIKAVNNFIDESDSKLPAEQLQAYLAAGANS